LIFSTRHLNATPEKPPKRLKIQHLPSLFCRFLWRFFTARPSLCHLFVILGLKIAMSATPAHRVSVGERINEHEPTGHLQAELRARRIRLTSQRRVVVQVMETASRHMDAGEILDLAQRIDPKITRVTVYRTLDLLKRHGLIDELDLLHLRGHRHFYESHGPRDHIHVACVQCGKVREFESQLYEELKQQISKDCGIEITVARTEVGGLCNDCRAKSP
jgi:Fur family transcriptional regulator, ferric uptake regulator